MRRMSCLIALAILVPAAPALSAAPEQQHRQDLSNLPEPGDPVARRQALNAMEADAARQQIAANIADRQRYEAQLAQAEMTGARQATAYADTLERHDDAVRDYRSERKEWEVRNPACWDGDAARCPAEPALRTPGE